MAMAVKDVVYPVCFYVRGTARNPIARCNVESKLMSD
jgi:hypothetical protein